MILSLEHDIKIILNDIKYAKSEDNLEYKCIKNRLDKQLESYVHDLSISVIGLDLSKKRVIKEIAN